MASLQKVVFTIAQGAQDSNAIGPDQLRNCRSMAIFAPGVLTGIVSAEAGDTMPDAVDASSVNFVTIQSPPGTDVTVDADKATVFTVTPFPQFRLHSSIAEASARTFIAWLNIGE